VTPLPFERLWRRFDPRASLAARLLLASFLAFLLPVSVFVFLIQKRLSELQTASSAQVAALRVTDASIRMAQDAIFRGEGIERRARVAEEAGWSIAAAAGLALAERLISADARSGAGRDADGHAWTSILEKESVALVSSRRPDEAAAGRDLARTRVLAPLMEEVRLRRPTLRSVSIWTASGVMRRSPWIDLDRANQESDGELEKFVFHRVARFPEALPAAGDQAVWSEGHAGPAADGTDVRYPTLWVPVRDASGRLAAGVAIEVDARRYVAESMETRQPPGDFWFATDSDGHVVFMTPRAAAVLGWTGAAGVPLSRAPSAELKRLAARGQGATRSSEEYLVDGKGIRVASARVGATSWVFYEGLSREALDAIRGEASGAFPPSSFSMLRRDVLLLFVLLLPAVLVVVGIVSRRVSAPVFDLVRAAEDIGRGRPVEVAGGEKTDELGRLAAAVDTMGRRVARRVETLKRLHQFSRSAYRMTDVKEVLARSAQAIASFTNAERVWFYLYDRNTNRLEAALPAFNLTEEIASRLKVSVDARSIAGMVFRTGEPYCTNDLGRDAYANRELGRLIDASNGVFAPLKTEEETLGVAVAINRTGGFGQEEIDALTSFADLASLLLRNARLYTTLTGTVDELRRASRLKDHFLQNVNHELRTPLTAIVGWTDLFEEGDVDEATRRRGVRQIRQSARVLLALIDDLLDLARLDRGALTLDLKPVFLSEVVQRSIETVRMMAEARGVVLMLAPLPEPMAPVRADALRLQQVLWNLLANAIQFTPQHGRIVVRVEREPERFLVSVEDDGIGIPESELPHVFERFRQVDGSATRGHAGMGIGLALARSLVELHGGSIWVSSVVGQGSRFTFAVPIRGAERRLSDSGAVPAAREVNEAAGS
jgi:signal transduction histidine kinase/PAS domain-containing protein/HAMP domain-containing protein